jgi:protein-disulfide isomerase
MRLFNMLTITSFILTAILGCSTTQDNQEGKQPASELEKLSKQVQLLQNQVVHLSKQAITLNRNQQNMAQKMGITTPQKQPIINIGKSFSIGSEDAKIAIVEFTDLHCPFCKKFHDKILPSLDEKFISTNKVRFIGKNYPIVQLHKNARTAALALECAKDQNTYIKAKDWLFKQGKGFNQEQFKQFTSELDLNNKKFDQCMINPATAAQIDNDLKLAKRIGVKSTPSFAIGLQKNGQVTGWKIIKGSQSVENFSKAIEEFTALAKTKK